MVAYSESVTIDATRKTGTRTSKPYVRLSLHTVQALARYINKYPAISFLLAFTIRACIPEGDISMKKRFSLQA